jgi:hypothetical protein
MENESKKHGNRKKARRSKGKNEVQIKRNGKNRKIGNVQEKKS